MLPDLKKTQALKNFAWRKARTLKNSTSFTGKGLYTGVEVTLTLEPSEEGIVFERTDLPGSPRFTADVDNVLSTPRCTILGVNEVKVQTVEHLLAALKAYQIDHVCIKINGPEVPILDGSALPLVRLIEESGVMELQKEVPILSLPSPVFWSQGEVHLIALPAEEWRLSYTLHYPQSAFIGCQFYSFPVSLEGFKNEIAIARTFCLYEEIVTLIENGSLKGGNLDSALIIQGHRVLNPEGLRMPNEMVRHKILDLIGDLSLLGCDLLAHIIAIRSGHAANCALTKQLKELRCL